MISGSALSRFGAKALLTAVAALSASAAYSQGVSTKDFTVFESNGPRSFTLSRAKGSYVAIHFLLKTACPYCMNQTHEYAVREHEVPGVYQVFLKPDSEEDILSWKGQFETLFKSKGDSTSYMPPVIYRDPDAALAKAFNIPDGYFFHNETIHYPALVILDPNGKEVFRYVGKSNRDRFSFDQFIAKMAELRK
jgi:thioredoxin-dependent peroxiredoxin